MYKKKSLKFVIYILKIRILGYICSPFIEYAGVVELVDTLDLGSSAERCESSSLSACTRKKLH